MDILLGIAIGNLPWAIAYSVIGASLSQTSAIKSYLDNLPLWTIIVVAFIGVFFLFLGVWALYTYTNEALQDVIREDHDSEIGTESESLLRSRRPSRRESKDREDDEVIC